MTSPRGKGYKLRIEQALSEAGWKVGSIDRETDRWADEHWLIESERQAYGLQLVITFMLDPQHDGLKQEAPIILVRASSSVPAGRMDENGRVADMWLQKGRRDDNLSRFVDEINQFRNLKHNPSSA